MYKSARDDFTQTMSVKGESFELTKLRGVCFYKTGKYEEALVDLDRALQYNLQDAGCYFYK